MNVPTIGHAKLVDKVISVAKQHHGDPIIYVSHTEDKKKNPLSYETKIKFLAKASANVIKADPEKHVKNIFDLLKYLNGKYKNIIVVAGSDRVTEYEASLSKYNGKDYSYASIECVSAGERDPDADDVASAISGTKMREYAIKNDFESFKKGIFPGGSTERTKEIFDEVRSVYGINESYTMVQFVSLLVENGLPD